MFAICADEQTNEHTDQLFAAAEWCMGMWLLMSAYQGLCIQCQNFPGGGDGTGAPGGRGGAPGGGGRAGMLDTLGEGGGVGRRRETSLKDKDAIK